LDWSKPPRLGLNCIVRDVTPHHGIYTSHPGSDHPVLRRFGGLALEQDKPLDNSPTVESIAHRVFRFVLKRSAILAISLVAVLPARAQDAKTSYPVMAPIDQYLMADRSAEISMARSAAPDAISRDATVLVLGRHGYETAIEGTSRFVCLVERSWMSPFDSPDFWNPKLRGPICYNPPAVRCILPYTINRTKLVLAGLSKAQMEESIKNGVAKGELLVPEPGAMSYMLSKFGYLGDSVGPWHPHLMFHVPKTDDAAWGANVVCSPVLQNDDYRDVPEPETIFMVPVSRWSDGTIAGTAK
jgi:hypothetical protein